MALIFTVRTFLRLPVSHGFIGIITFASSVQSFLLPSVAIFVNTLPCSNLSLYSFHSSQWAFGAYMLEEQVCFPRMNRVLVFGGETLHYSIAMMSFCYIINDVMDLPQNYK